MLTLYHDHNAVCCQKVELTLVEKGVQYEGRVVSLFKSEQYSPEYLKINPRGIVPTIVHNGHTIIESTVICEYINEALPGSPLLPENPADRAQVRIWTKLVDEEIHEAGSTLSFCAMFRDRMLAMPESEREKRYRNVGNPIRDEMYRSSVDFGVESPVAYRAIASFEMMARDLELHLSSGPKEWIAGDRFSLAEIALTPYFARIEYLSLLDIWLSGRPSVARWCERVKARASYDQVIAHPLSADDTDRMRSSGEKIFASVAERLEEYRNANAVRSN